MNKINITDKIKNTYQKINYENYKGSIKTTLKILGAGILLTHTTGCNQTNVAVSPLPDANKDGINEIYVEAKVKNILKTTTNRAVGISSTCNNQTKYNFIRVDDYSEAKKIIKQYSKKWNKRWKKMKINNIINKIEIGDIHKYKNLNFIRLYGENTLEEEITLIGKALDDDKIKVEDTGSINKLQVYNDSDQKIFIPQGIILDGETQNRTVQFPYLVKENSKASIDVKCAEKLHPIRKGRKFKNANTIIVSRGRTSNLSQQDVWDEINHTSHIIGTRNATEDYITSVKKANLKPYLNALGNPKQDQIGFAYAIKNGRKIEYYIDFFANNEQFTDLSDMLKESIGATAITNNDTKLDLNRDKLKDLMINAVKIDLTRMKQGRNLKGNLYKANSQGNLLIYDNSILQATLYKQDKEVPKFGKIWWIKNEQQNQ